MFQVPLFVVALLVIYDGLAGPQLAPLNMATVLVWIHYRGGVILSLVLLANVFCMGCPFTLLRSVMPGLARHGARWPRRLRNKWGSISLVFVLLWIYEWADLWASPSLTAWLVVGYFVAATMTEVAFQRVPLLQVPLSTRGLQYALFDCLVAPDRISRPAGLPGLCQQGVCEREWCCCGMRDRAVCPPGGKQY